MPRKLKTYITNLGFFELAIAAPSMKAALEAWGMSHNAFQHGFAQQTEDPAIVAATSAQPGVVLKRAVGSSGEFKKNAELPKSLPSIKPPKVAPRPTPKERQRAQSKAANNPKADRAAVISFEKERAKREREREREETRLEKERADKRRATDRAEAILDDALSQHEEAMAAIESEQDALARRAEKEVNRWEAQRKKLSEAVDRAKE